MFAAGCASCSTVSLAKSQRRHAVLAGPVSSTRAFGEYRSARPLRHWTTRTRAHRCRGRALSGPRAPRAAAVGASSGGFGGWTRRCLPPILRRCITRQLRQAHWAARMSPRGARALNAGDAVSLTHAMERVVAGPCCPPPCSSSAAAAWAGAVAGPVQKLARWRTSWLSVGNTIRQSGHLICAGWCVSEKTHRKHHERETRTQDKSGGASTGPTSARVAACCSICPSMPHSLILAPPLPRPDPSGPAPSEARLKHASKTRAKKR